MMSTMRLATRSQSETRLRRHCFGSLQSCARRHIACVRSHCASMLASNNDAPLLPH